MIQDQVITTSSTDAATSEATIGFYLHVETPSEEADRRSNESADAAVEWGCRGKVLTAAILAEMADMWAWRAEHIRSVERYVHNYNLPITSVFASRSFTGDVS